MDPVNVIRAPSLKRGKPDERLTERIKLKKIIGLTVCSSAGLDVSPTTGVLAYPAGCTVVLFNSKKLSQTYLLNTSKKAITAVAYSQCGRYLATGECGINPTIKVWELDLSPGNESNCGGSVIAEFSGHKYAVNCVAFSPTGKYLVSVGSQHDNIVNVFDWKSNLKIASNKVSAKVVAVSFSDDGNYFVTVGNRHVKYWYLEGGRKYKEPIPLMGRSAILGELRNNDFCAVACGKGDMIDSTYAITRNGHLVEFNSRRLLDKWVMCRTTTANCMVASVKFIFVGCGDAIIRVFNAETLEYITTLPRTHYLGVDVSQGVQISHMMSAPPNSKYPDTIAIVFDESRSRVSCVYNDHSLYIWDLRDIRRVGKSNSFLYHSACIWGVETVPSNFLRNGNTQDNNLPSDCFITCSSDDTVRFWGLDNCETNEVYRKNIYSKDLLKSIYIDSELNFIKDTDNPTQSNEKSSSYDGRNGVRCIKVSAECDHLATGDRSGNIRIYDLKTMKQIQAVEAHDSEVLCLEYTNDKIEKRLLASASRDRLIHVFDVENNYRILQTLDDHSSSITSVKFIGAGLTFQMVSCGADKSIIFRNYQNNQFTRGNNCSGKNTLYDMEVDSTAKHILTACQDRNIRVYGTQNAKHTKTFKGSHSDEGTLIKLSLDLSGIYIATSCTDKTLSVYDYYSNECMAKMYGHSELVTGLKFTNDCRHLISASGDGCIFVWQVPHDMIVTMQARLSQQAMRSGHPPSIPRQLTNPFSDSMHSEQSFGSPPGWNDDVPTTPNYKLSEVGQLPMWAKKKPDDNSSSPVMGSSPNQQIQINNQKPRGKWAQRGQFDAETLDLRSIVDTPNPPTQAPANILISNNTPTSGYNSGSSKDVYSNYLSEDSSIDSGMENRRDHPFMAPKVVMEHNKMHSLNSESNTEHDGDVEDISDGERTSSDHGMIYYPGTHASTPTDFKVNEMKEDELRKSIRRQKLEKQGLSVSQIITATSAGTGTSDDEDDASTPSGDNAERSLASTLGGSSESIPHPSTFLQVALDGPGSDSGRDKERGRKSISAMHNTDNKTASISKSYTNSKKEELLKVINEAKQKLENVGYKSSLRASQSISDLSHANVDARTRLLRGVTGNKAFMPDDDENESSIRRACSLSDLSMGKGFVNKSPTSASKSPKERSTTRNLPKRSASSVGKSSTSGMGMRSVSVGMLNQASDSDQSEPIASRGGVLRPTISSQNKTNGSPSPGSQKYINPRSAAGIISRRKGMQNSYSSVNLTTAGQDESSSEESPPPNVATSPTKPVVPPRPRNIPQDQRRITNINTLLNSKKMELAAGMVEMPCKDSDIENADITTQLCTSLISQLMVTTNNVMQLHQRLRSNDEPTSTGNNNLMLKELENAVIMTQNMLTKITVRETTMSNGGSNNISHDKMNNNHSPTTNGGGEYTQMYEKCNDLLSKVQNQKHVNNNN